MTKGISPDNEDFLNRQVADGKYTNREQALDAAVELLRHQTDVLTRIDLGRRQLDEGDGTDYDDATLSRRFDQLKGRVIQLFGSGQNGR
ncbi:MAG: hypothetical protein R3C02_26350 [Planctomycetaceae bacterium]|nr:hypothetical protein [Planctomycetaceae bacterium]